MWVQVYVVCVCVCKCMGYKCLGWCCTCLEAKDQPHMYLNIIHLGFFFFKEVPHWPESH